MLPKKPKRECSACNSTGKKQVPSFTYSSRMIDKSCEHCKGTGQYIDMEAELDYYKSIAERAIGALKRLASSEAFDVSRYTTQEEYMRIKYAETVLREIQASEEE